MKKMILLFSHKLTQEQIEDAKISLQISEFITLPKNLQQLWSNISPELESLQNELNPIKSFIKDITKKDDVVLIQGDFGATYIMVNFVKDLELKAVYATTKRIVKEINENGKIIKKSIFKHRRYREYGI